MPMLTLGSEFSHNYYCSINSISKAPVIPLHSTIRSVILLYYIPIQYFSIVLSINHNNNFSSYNDHRNPFRLDGI